MNSQAEENYLKAIFKIIEKEGKGVGAVAASTNAIAASLDTSAASVTDMLRRLSDKGLIAYEKYRGVQLSIEGRRVATALIRKHRLWEVFLTEKLGFAWDEVHELAEQLEHVQGELLVNRLDTFLNYPRFDPHGDPIPDAEGRWMYRLQKPLSELSVGDCGVVTGVDEHSVLFLQHLDQLGLTLGAAVEVLEKFSYDDSMRVRISEREVVLSKKTGQNVFVKT